MDIIKTLGGKSLLPTLYVVAYTMYTIAFTQQMGVMIVRVFYLPYYTASFILLFFILFRKNNSKFIRALSTLFLAIVVYGIFSYFYFSTSRELNGIKFIQVHLMSLLPIFAFYYFGIKDKINSNWFCYITVLLVTNAYFLYLHSETVALENLASNRIGYINNSGYIWASLLPIIAFWNKKKIIQYSLIALVTVFVMICVKRGAILVSIIAIVYFIIKSFKTVSSTKKILIIILSIIATIAFISYFNYLIETNEFFYMRFMVTKAGDTSGRESIVEFFIKYLLSNENGIRLIWGNGAFATDRLLGIEAHNDWLEYAVDMGLIGVLLYLRYWEATIRNYYIVSKFDTPEITIAMGMTILITLPTSFFSMSFYDLSFCSAAVLGYTMSSADNIRKRKLSQVV